MEKVWPLHFLGLIFFTKGTPKIIIIRVTTVDGRNPANHLGCINPCKSRDICHINWCRMSSINSMSFPGSSAGDLFGIVKT